MRSQVAAFLWVTGGSALLGRLLIPDIPITFGDGWRGSLSAARAICGSFPGSVAQGMSSGTAAACSRVGLAWDGLTILGYGGAAAIVIGIWLYISAGHAEPE